MADWFGEGRGTKGPGLGALFFGWGPGLGAFFFGWGPGLGAFFCGWGPGWGPFFVAGVPGAGPIFLWLGSRVRGLFVDEDPVVWAFLDGGPGCGGALLLGFGGGCGVADRGVLGLGGGKRGA